MKRLSVSPGRQPAPEPVLPPAETRQKTPASSPETAARRAQLGHNLGRIVETASGAPARPSAPIQQRAAPGVEVGPSQIHRRGLIANRVYGPGEKIELGATASGPKWELTRAGRYTNHQSRPSARLEPAGDSLVMSAGKMIKPGEEVTVNYNQVGRLLGSERLAWRGQDVPHQSDEFFQKDD